MITALQTKLLVVIVAWLASIVAYSGYEKHNERGGRTSPAGTLARAHS
jgi:hypothetical protein